jgi:phosphopantetheine adenylyltransferase
MREYIVVCGTFEGFHEGHELLVDSAIEYANGMEKELKVLISGDLYAKNKNPNTSSWFKRKMVVKEHVDEYLKKWSIKLKVSYDVYCEPFTESRAFAVVTSKDTIQESIEYRDKFDPNLYIIIAPTIYGEDGEPMSSTKLDKELFNESSEDIKVGYFSNGLKFTIPIKRYVDRKK